jgi:hypothetical protein
MAFQKRCMTKSHFKRRFQHVLAHQLNGALRKILLTQPLKSSRSRNTSRKLFKPLNSQQYAFL